MLVLRREYCMNDATPREKRKDEVVLVHQGVEIRVRMTYDRKHGLSLSFDAPVEVKIVRGEVYGGA